MGRIFLLALLILFVNLSHIPQFNGEPIPLNQMICDGGFCLDGVDHILDCSSGVCHGDSRPQNFPTIIPAFDDGAWLNPEDRVIGVVIDNIARAYPLRIMNYYETVLDEISHEPILISYCPVCGSGIVYSRIVDEQEIVLYNSGELWRFNLVLYDNLTKSRWTQIAGKSIHGDLYGTQLEFIQSSQVMWEDWKANYPDTEVMSRPVDVNNELIFDFDLEAILPKQQVYGVVLNNQSVAFPFDIIRNERLVNIEIFDFHLTIVFSSMDINVFDNGGVLLVFIDGENMLKSKDGSFYNSITGKSQDPSLDSLNKIEGKSMKRFAWEDFFPDSIFYVGNGKFDNNTPSSSDASGFELYWAFSMIIALTFVFQRVKRLRN
ncbi:MAG: DUF3179 domain-containing protein [Candidatus Heimdallarchaeota archaeon]|nr:DUF3179 domain-containing protein [Candidatus Heimdallarchaeota archaeon]